MSQQPTYYEILGVSRAASVAEIRAAYLRLMKAHHPDTSGARTAESERADVAGLINRGYAVLRDPAARADYDAELARADKPVVRQLQQAPRSRVQPGRWRAAALLFCAVVPAAYLVLLMGSAPEQTTRELLASAAGWVVTGAPDADPGAPLPPESQARQLALLAKTSSPDKAELFSRQCFDGAAGERTLGGAEPCVLFDTAFLYWRKPPRPDDSFPVYFADEMVRMRHSDALAPFGAGADARLRALRQRAFHALAGELKAEPEARAKADKPLANRSTTAPSSGLSDSAEQAVPVP